MAATAKEFFEGLQAHIDPEKIKGINATYQWDLSLIHISEPTRPY